MKFTPEDVEKLKAAREQNPEFAAMIDKIRAEFPGSKITYLKIGDLEYGEKTDESKCVVPYIPPSAVTTAPTTANRTAGRTAKTVGEKRRSNTRYKG